jgi:transcriptional regulator with XRE-family HTH domain
MSKGGETMKKQNDELKIARLAKGLTQKEIAKVLGVGDTAICNWENGLSKPRGRIAKAYAYILDLPLEQVI